jgi:hypothetical protein
VRQWVVPGKELSRLKLRENTVERDRRKKRK